MIIIAEERKLMTEREIDKKYLGKWVLLDRTDIPPTHDGGYVVAYGDESDDVWNELCDLGQKVCNGHPMIKFGLEVRGLPWYGL